MNAINSARGGLFSVGAAFLNFDSANEGIFFNAGGIQRLSINEAADAIPALPEPSSLSLAAAALAGLLVFRCCRKPG